MERTTTIRITPETKKRLDKLGCFKETYDDLICRLLDLIKTKK